MPCSQRFIHAAHGALTHNSQLTAKDLPSSKMHSLRIFQLRVPAELHAAGPVGDRVRDPGGQHPADHPPEQEPLPGAPHRVARGIVSMKQRSLDNIHLSTRPGFRFEKGLCYV